MYYYRIVKEISKRRFYGEFRESAGDDCSLTAVWI